MTAKRLSDCALALTLCGSLLGSAPGLPAQSPINWRRADSISIGEDFFRVDVSSTRRVRVATRSKTGQLIVSSDLDPGSLSNWTRSVWSALAVRAPSEFENTIALQPAVRESDSTGYVITVADSVGNTHAIFVTRPDAETIVTALERSTVRATSLTNEELALSTPLPPDLSSNQCDRIRDSVFTRVPPEHWPNAHSLTSGIRPPKPPDDMGDGRITAALTVLPNGMIDSASFTVTGTTDMRYERDVLDYLAKQKWAPARVAGCPVVSRASLAVARLGIIRHR